MHVRIEAKSLRMRAQKIWALKREGHRFNRCHVRRLAASSIGPLPRHAWFQAIAITLKRVPANRCTVELPL